MRIVGPGWAGNSRQGFEFNPVGAIMSNPGGGGGGVIIPTGACCTDDGDCSITTSALCDISGGHYQGHNTTCDDVDCTNGGCGTTGACCVGFDCSIECPQDCFNSGGNYRGDDTTCDPNPCSITPPPCCNTCGFLHNGIHYLTKEVSLSSNTDCHAFGQDQTSSASITTIQTINTADCSLTVICFGGADTHNCPEFGDVHFSWSNCGFSGDCGWSGNSPCETNNPLHTIYCDGGSGGCPAGVLGDQTDDCTSHLDNGICLIDVSVTVTYSNPCDHSC